MKKLSSLLALNLIVHLSLFAVDDPWPKIIQAQKAVITIYQPQPESLKGTILQSRAAVSVMTSSMKDPVFGVVWSTAILNTDRNERMAALDSLKIIDVRFPGNPDSSHIQKLKEIIEDDSKNWNLQISLDRLATSLEEADDAKALQDKINNTPPKFYFTTEPTVLVLVDGDPKLVKVEKSNLQRVANTPNSMYYDPSQKKYYLNGNGIWYESQNVTSGWVQNNKLTGDMKSLAKDLAKQGIIPDPDSVDMSVVPKILVSTEGAELIQTKGKPEFATIKGTNLLYAENSESQIFLDITSQKYYVLTTGRWFSSSSLENGPWTYVSQENLPVDFKKIPEGSEKDIVLASVAGTKQAEDAVHDAMIPQTASVDRKTATTSVSYDGSPKFSKVSGTDELYYAENSEQTVIKDDGDKKYYCVDDGVWYESNSANGPWTVCTKRPDEVNEISAESPVYNIKYVYIYDYTPSVVYVGYTPGYTGCYVYGPTVVYGTGYYYYPWYGAYYYPRPVTYGFNMTYNPWTGWSYGYSMSYGWYGGYGGWYGPPVYRPPYHYPCNHYYGAKPVHYNNIYYSNNYYYGGRNSSSGNGTGGNTSGGRPAQLPSNTGNNIYNSDKRPGVSAGTGVANRPGANNPNGGQGNANRPNNGGANQGVSRPGANTGGSVDQRPGANNIYSDKTGNVYKNKGDNWQQYNGQKFENTNKNSSGTKNDSRPAQGQNQNANRPNAGQGQNQNMNKQGTEGGFNQNQMNQSKQNRNEGQTRTQNYNQYQHQTPSGGGSRSGGGSGSPRR